MPYNVYTQQKKYNLKSLPNSTTIFRHRSVTPMSKNRCLFSSILAVAHAPVVAKTRHFASLAITSLQINSGSYARWRFHCPQSFMPYNVYTQQKKYNLKSLPNSTTIFRHRSVTPMSKNRCLFSSILAVAHAPVVAKTRHFASLAITSLQINSGSYARWRFH